uniref:Uncharacterized protein n=1 Tax=Arundo donax TaxID=35708 RepID=A0A0A8YEM3_ARUDO
MIQYDLLFLMNLGNSSFCAYPRWKKKIVSSF